MYVDRYVFCVLAKCGYAVSRATAPRHTPSLGGREQFVPSHADDSESHHPSSRAQPCCAHCGTHPVPGRAAVGGKRVGSCVRTGAISSQPEKPIPHFVPGQRGANPGVPTTVFFFFFFFPSRTDITYSQPRGCVLSHAWTVCPSVSQPSRHRPRPRLAMYIQPTITRIEWRPLGWLSFMPMPCVTYHRYVRECLGWTRSVEPAPARQPKVRRTLRLKLRSVPAQPPYIHLHYREVLPHRYMRMVPLPRHRGWRQRSVPPPFFWHHPARSNSW